MRKINVKARNPITGKGVVISYKIYRNNDGSVSLYDDAMRGVGRYASEAEAEAAMMKHVEKRGLAA